MKTMQYNNTGDRNFSFLVCPVPLRQQPVFQYRELTERSFFRWVTLTNSVYGTKLSVVWSTGVLFSLYGLTIQSESGITLADILWSTIVGEFAVFACLLKLYLAWNYVHSRLMNQEITYKVPRERKIAVWQKSQSIAMRDYLIARFQVRQLLERIRHTVLSILFLFGINSLVLFLITNSQSIL